MIEQPNYSTVSNPIQNRFHFLCTQGNKEQFGVVDLVKNLFQIQQTQTQNSNLNKLVSSIIQVAHLPSLTDKAKNVILDAIFFMLGEIIKISYKIGIFDVSLLLSSQNIQALIQNVFLQPSYNGDNSIKVRKQIFSDFLSSKNIDLISQKLEIQNIKSQPILTTLGAVKLLISTISYFYLSQKQQNQKKQLRKNILKLAFNSSQNLIEYRSKNITKFQLQVFIDICFHHQNSDHHNWCGLAWDSIIFVFSTENLEKKLYALSILDRLIQNIDKNNARQPIKENKIECRQKILKFFGLILQPRNHEQILMRSINFLLFWLSNMQQKKDLQQGLIFWLINLILKSDTRTSNIFATCWQKLIAIIQNIDQLQLNTIYEVSINILNQFIKNDKQQKTQEEKIIKINSPLINKKFYPLLLHHQATLNYLTFIWESLHHFSKFLCKQFTEVLKKSIIDGISQQFNLYVINQSINILNTHVQKYNIRSNEENLSTISQTVSFIYDIGISIFTWLQNFGKNNPLSLQQSNLSKQICNLFRNSTFLYNIVISHNPDNIQQLKQLINLSDKIIQQFRDVSFQSQFVLFLMKKVDNNDAFFLNWLQLRLDVLQHMDFKKKLTQALFFNLKAYSNLSISSLKSLLSIISLSHYDQNERIKLCLQILKLIDEENRQHAITITLCQMWSPLEICKQNFLIEINKNAREMNFSDIQQLEVYLQLIKICSQQFPKTSDILFSQNIALQEELQIKAHIQQSGLLIQKIIKCSDSICLNKIIKKEIQPLINTEFFSHLSIQSIIFNQNTITQISSASSLRKIGFTPYKINEIQVKLRDKKYLLLKNMKDGMLRHLLDNFYKFYELNKNIFQILNIKQLKNFLKYLQNQVLNNNNINLEQVRKDTLFTILQNILKKLFTFNHNQIGLNRTLISEIYDFLLEIDVEGLLSKQKIQCPGYSHCNLMSQNEYILSKAISLLLNMSGSNNKEKKEQGSKISTNKIESNRQRLRQQRISYQFISFLNVGEYLQNYVCRNLDSLINQKSISDNYYQVAFGLECLWIALKKPQLMIAFIQSGKFTEILKILGWYIVQINKNNIMEQKQLQMYLKIVISALKIVNKIVRLNLVKMQRQQITLITRSPKDLLNLQQTKINLQKISSEQSLKQVISQDKDAIQVHNIARSFLNFPNLNVSIEDFMPIIHGINQLMTKYNKHPQRNNIFLLFYQASRLNCMILMLNPEQNQNISQLMRNLNNDCSQLSLVCRSMLYIYVVANPQHNENVLENLTKYFLQNKHENSKAFYQIFGQCFSMCENQTIIKKVTQIVLNIIMDLKEEQVNTSSQSFQKILLIINKNIRKIDKSALNHYVQMMESFLFDSTGPIKAISSTTRAIIYQFVHNCLSINPSLEVKGLISKIHQQIQIATSTQEELKQKQMGVGLKNLGNICYMNSQLQLLHSIKPFVNSINKIKTQFPLLLGLQKLFTRLTYSFNKYINPEQFILSFDPAVDISLQEDTTQFLISFFEKLEQGEKNKEFGKVIKQLFKGQTVSNISCSQCDFGKNKIQDFFIYSLNIKNENTHFSDLSECIQNAKNPEIIFDVNCQNCQKKTQFSKTTSLRNIPPYFLINLKRLVFDYENPYTKAKIHSQLTFPQQFVINNQKLILKAVITHSGTGEFGHYYTSVRQNQNWIIYNDAKVYPMPDNGKADNWYGGVQSDGNITYSANAYVLLYEKVDKKIQTDNNVVPELAEEISSIKKSNRVLLTRQLLFGKDYMKDFVNFAFNIAKLPNNVDRYLSIYQLIGNISYHFSVVPSSSPDTYFKDISNNTNEQSLISLIYQYKQHNNQMLFHRNRELRLFFFTFLTKIFSFCIGKSELTLVYSCQIINKYIPLIKQNHMFANSGQYTKLVAYLIRQFHKYRQFLKLFFQQKIITEILLLCKARKLQIQYSYQTGIQIMQPFLQVLISFISVFKNSEQIMQFFNQCQQHFLQIRQAIKNDQDFIELIFLNCSNQQYIRFIIQVLQLNQEQTYLQAIFNLCRQQLCNQTHFDARFCKSYSFIILYLYHNYFNQDRKSKQTFCMNILGMIFPFKQKLSKNATKDIDERLSCLKDRIYQYRTTYFQKSFISVISQILIGITQKIKIQMNSVEVLDILLKLLLQILKNDPLFVSYFHNLCSPIGLYGDFCLFLANQVYQLLKNIQQRKIIISDKNTKFDEKRASLLQSVEGFRTILRQYSMQSQVQLDQPILSGIISKQPQLIEQSPINNVFVRVEQYSYHWIGFIQDRKSPLLDYVDSSYNLIKEFANDRQMNKIMRAIQNEQIEQQQTLSRAVKKKSRRNDQNKLDIEQNHSINSGCIRRKIIISNISESQCIANIEINCKNMKNKNITLLLKLAPAQQQQIWVQKMKMKQSWEQMNLYVNGVQLKMQANQTMRMEESQPTMMESV